MNNFIDKMFKKTRLLRRREAVAIFLAFLFISSPILGTCSTEFQKFTSENWTGGAIRNDDGHFSHCYAATAYSNGINFAIGLTRDYEIRLLLNHQEWELPLDEIYDVSLSIDDKYIGEFKALSVDPKMLRIEIGSRHYIYSRLRFGRILKISAQSQDFYLNLKGSNKAFLQVKECVDLACSLPASETNPFASLYKNPFSSKGQTKTEDIEHNQKILHSLLTASGLENLEFVNPKFINFDKANYAWSSGNISGVLFSVPYAELGIDHWIKEFIGSVASECEGTFGSQLSATVTIGKKQLKQFYAACSGDNEELFLAATAVEMDSGILVFMNYTAGEPVTLRDINNNLAEIFRSLFKE